MPRAKMKIVYLVASSDISGGLRVVLQQAEGLARRGHQVTVVCPDSAPDWYPLRNAIWETTPFATSKAVEEADIGIATFWTTVAPAVKGIRGAVFHLCQGYEADFSVYSSKRREIESAYEEHTHKLVISPHIKTRLMACGYPNVTYVGQTFDPKEFPPHKGRRFDNNPPEILLVGVYEAEVKGIREVLEALAEVKAHGTEFKLRRVSVLPLSHEEHSVFPADKYHECLSPTRMVNVYCNSDLLIGPSHPEEGFGLPVLEALSSGLPVLLSDTPGHRHIARDAAEYFPCGKVSALITQITAILRDPSRRADLSVRGPIQAARFRTAHVVDRLLAAFKKSFPE